MIHSMNVYGIEKCQSVSQLSGHETLCSNYAVKIVIVCSASEHTKVFSYCSRFVDDGVLHLFYVFEVDLFNVIKPKSTN